MVKLIYGDIGSGKSEYVLSCLERDASEGAPAILLVPEQQTVAAERELLERLPASAQLNIEVLNFSRLANRVFRKAGGLVYNYASAGQRTLIMWRALCQCAPMLTEYHERASSDRSLPATMLSVAKELSSSGISPEELERFAADMPDSTLRRKLSDIATVTASYRLLLSQSHADPSSDLDRLCELLDTTARGYFSGMRVYLDSFYSLTGQEHAVLRRIMGEAECLTATVPLPSPTYRGIDTSAIRDYSDKLRSDAAGFGGKVETVTLGENRRASATTLRLLSEKLWRMDEEVALTDDDGSVELWQAADIYDEAEAAASRVRALLEDGYRCRDIAVIARDATKYRGILDTALETMGVPYYFSEKRDLSTSPLSRLILSALRIKQFGWRREDVIAHVKTGLLDISTKDADLFEEYTAKWSISGKRLAAEGEWTMNPDGYNAALSPRGEEKLAAANKVHTFLLEKLKKYFAEINAAASCAELCRATVGYVEESGAPKKLKELAVRELAAERGRESAETARTYDTFLTVLDELCDCFGDGKKPEIHEFAFALSTLLEQTQMGSIPTSSDEVSVGSANMIRTSGARAVIILGACDGEFPAAATGGGLLSAAEREELIALSLPISGGRESDSSEELFFFRRAVGSASDKLIVYTRAGSTPSVAFVRLHDVCAHVSVKNTSEHLFDRIRTAASAAEYATLLEGTAEGEAIRRVLGDKMPYRVPVSAENDELSEDVAGLVYGKRLTLSQTKLESFTKCHFAYCCNYLLSLDEGKRAEFSADSIGTFVHFILEKYLIEVFLRRGGKFPSGEEKAAIIRKHTADYALEHLPTDAGRRIEYMTERLCRLASLIIEDIECELSDSSFCPEAFELSIGHDIPSPEIPLSDGGIVTLNGKIDRVDVFRHDGKAYLRTVDYKTGKKLFSIGDIDKKKNLQLLLYIYALTDASYGGDSVPAAISYLSASSERVGVKGGTDAASVKNSVFGEFKRSGLILDDPAVLAAVSRSENKRYLMVSGRSKNPPTLTAEAFDYLNEKIKKILKEVAEDMRGGGAHARPSEKDDCKYCAYNTVCRAAKKSKNQSY